MLGLLSLIYSFVFLLNSVVILNEKRFLDRVCLPLNKEQRSTLPKANRKLVEFIIMVRTVFEFPLIFLNIVFIVYELLLG